jgi:acylglycerol lipase
MEEFYWSFQQTKFRGLKWVPAHFDRVMIIVHGIGEHIGRYEQVAAFFMEQGFAVVGIDHYGHGKSDGRKGASKGFEFMFSYLQDFLTYAAELYAKPLVMYGHSMGGGVLTGFLLKKQPQLAAAIISAPALIIASKPGVLLRGLLKVLNVLVPHIRIPQGLPLEKISHNPAAVEKFRNDPLRHGKLSFRLAHDMIENGQWCLQHANLLNVRTLLIHGNADEFTAVEGSRLFAERAPAGMLTYQEWEGMYHEMHNEIESAKVLQFISSWL